MTAVLQFDSIWSIQVLKKLIELVVDRVDTNNFYPACSRQ